MGGIQYRLDQPLIPPEAELIDDQGQDNGDGEGPQQAVQADEDGIFDHADTGGRTEEAFKPIKSHPLAARISPAGFKIAEGNLNAVHGNILVDDGQHYWNQ